ncbi:MAG: adenylate/guanylate cyclase domain-containing protein [Desulfobulbaceae bacterium]|nr:adenylate/guanylate cyclase domain-containing protein [Desulfobulbaceae bacterium]HIJ91261.1 adenylate/guanylate cyclase domain-containing protein [Deltaproteobacteria bacterium]
MQYRTRRIMAIAMGFSLIVLLLWAQFARPAFFGDLSQRLELLAFDIRLRAVGGIAWESQAKESAVKVVIVDIDERSLTEHGRWPWSRAKVAALVEQLAKAGSAVVAFDVMFSEPEVNPAMEVASFLKKQGEGSPILVAELARFEESFDRDRQFAMALNGKEVVLGYSFQPHELQRIGVLPESLTVTNPQLIPQSSLAAMRGYTANLPILAQAALGSGFFSLHPDLDGVVRRAPLVARFNNQLFSSLALETLRHFLLVDSLTLHTSRINELETVEAIGLDGFASIPTDAQGQMIVPYLGAKGSFPYVSASEVLAGTVSVEALEGAIVLVGTTAPGLFDLRSTPVQAVYPGVEIHANLIDAILAKRFLVQPAWAQGADFVVMVVAGLALALALPFFSPLWQMLGTLAMAAALVLGNLVFWKQGLVLSLAMPLILTSLLATSNLAFGFLVESRSRRQLKEMFGQYVPPQIVQEMSENPQKYSFEGETRELTVLFADIRGFTTLSETLTAADLKKLLNRYFTPMTKIIFETRGTIDKYVGDMIMAFWGAPVPDAQHGVQAIEAALRMLQETERLQLDFSEKGLPRIAIGIGINTGLMNVGDMGSEFRRAYTVLGDAVNLGSRLEGTTKYYGVGLVVGETTRAAAGETFVFRELDLVRVKGKAQAIRVYEPVCRSSDADEALLRELDDYHRILAEFRDRRWEEARGGFSRLRDAAPDRRLYGIYLERIEALAGNDPGESWDGVYERKEK